MSTQTNARTGAPAGNVQPSPNEKGLLRLPPKARRINDACAALGISRATMYKLALQGKVKLVKIAGRTLVPETEIDRLASGDVA